MTLETAGDLTPRHIGKSISVVHRRSFIEGILTSIDVRVVNQPFGFVRPMPVRAEVVLDIVVDGFELTSVPLDAAAWEVDADDE